MADYIKDPRTQQAVYVNERGQIASEAISSSSATQAAMDGDLYNIVTPLIALTSANKSAVYYIKNTNPNTALVISRVFYNFGVSTGGSGDAICSVVRNPTSGTLLTLGTSYNPRNLNFGSNKILTVDSYYGGEGLTQAGETLPAVSTLITFPSPPIRVEFDSIILPQGASLGIDITPPLGNTALNVSVGLNLFVKAV